jgi:hypothetical protein
MAIERNVGMGLTSEPHARRWRWESAHARMRAAGMGEAFWGGPSGRHATGPLRGSGSARAAGRGGGARTWLGHGAGRRVSPRRKGLEFSFFLFSVLALISY